MKVRITYEAIFSYQEPVSFSPHTFRLFPKIDRSLALARTHFRTNPGATVHYRRDIFDNEVASCFYPEPSKTMEVELELEFLLKEKNAFDFLLENHAYKFPLNYRSEEQLLLAPYLAGSSLDLPFWKPSPGPTLDRLIELNTALFENIRYERREQGPAQSPEETLTKGSGACRDFAQLLAAALRSNGIATRLASGYLCEFASKEKKAEGALHAWCEAYLPGAGWLGLDPTNGILCNQNHITAAVGLAFEDISPLSGNYYGDQKVASTLEARLELSSSPA